MVQVNLSQLVGRLNDNCRQTLESAVGFCMSRGHYNVEVEHWLFKLLEPTNNDVAAVLKHFGVQSAALSADTMRVIDKFKAGNAREVSLSPDLVSLVRDAWLLASIEYQERRVRSGHLLLALLEGADDLRARSGYKLSGELRKISAEALRAGLPAITAHTDEGQHTNDDATDAADGTAGDATAGPAPVGGGKTPALDQFTTDLTAQAARGKIDPVVGRDPEIRQIIDILTRRRQNNPILTGEAGVGKTAVVEGFALRVAAGDVPPSLRDVSIRSLDLALLQAGAGVKGEFENRLKSVIAEVKSSPKPIILFIDEAHTLIGAGGQSGQGDAANLLKPALARGELRTIAATTWAEYKKFFEKDAALSRRFQVVKVEEPNEPTAVLMLRGLIATLERHHRVHVREEAVIDAVKLSNRFITGRQLPDKAVSVLDTTCARVGISQFATPPAIEDARRRIDHLGINLGVLAREQETGVDHSGQIAQVTQLKAAVQDELLSLESRWKQEKELVARIQQIREQLFAPTAGASPDAGNGAAPAAAPAAGAAPAAELIASERDRLRQQLAAAQTELTGIQGESPLVHPCVDSQAIASTISTWTGIPLGRMVADEVQTVLRLKDRMAESIIGQGHALEAIARRIRTSRANLSDPRTPIGVFLLAGTSGVGKTETAVTLANLLYGGEQNMTVINMSEFKEEHKVSLLMGSPPGYVGYGEGGILTEAVRRKPYSVVLLDEMEKAHPGVQDVFYQVFDKGTMKDGEGRDIDFKNTVILMTTNAGTDLIKSLFSDPETAPDAEGLAQALFPELLKTFKPAFLGRLSVVPYFPLADDVMRRIIELKLGKVARRVRENYKAEFSYSPELVDHVARRCTEVDTGARNVDHILTGALLPELSTHFLGRVAEGLPIGRVRISVDAGGAFQYDIS